MLLLAACAPAAPASPIPLTRVAEVESPTGIVPAPGKSGAVWVTSQPGRILEVSDQGATVVLDIHTRVKSGGEMGLLGLAIKGDRLVVNYTFQDGNGLHTRIAAYTIAAGKADPASEVSLLEYDQPWSNHNSGAMDVGPDGMLYLGVGDGGSAGDPRGTGQRRDDFLGSILRIDVSTTPYTVPADNPFVGQEGVRPEIWAYGVRNPWGMHFDGDTLYFADVGQNKWEEVNRGVKGGNYGWNVKEGTHCFSTTPCTGDFVEPLADYGRDLGASVTGGVVYRGPSVPALDGKYLYADFAFGNLWALPLPSGAPTLVGKLDANPSTFGVDDQRRVYIGDYRGVIWRIGA